MKQFDSKTGINTGEKIQRRTIQQGVKQFLHYYC